jgi:hypothetical protein
MEATKKQREIAFKELIKLSGHYAELLNMYDGGNRRSFNSPDEWIARLVETGTMKTRESQSCDAIHKSYTS